MSDYKRGDLVKHERGVYKVCGFTKDRLLTPDGWLVVDETGMALNPNYCTPYDGATSVLPPQLRNE